MRRRRHTAPAPLGEGVLPRRGPVRPRAHPEELLVPADLPGQHREVRDPGARDRMLRHHGQGDRAAALPAARRSHAHRDPDDRLHVLPRPRGGRTGRRAEPRGAPRGDPRGRRREPASAPSRSRAASSTPRASTARPPRSARRSPSTASASTRTPSGRSRPRFATGGGSSSSTSSSTRIPAGASRE